MKGWTRPDITSRNKMTKRKRGKTENVSDPLKVYGEIQPAFNQARHIPMGCMGGGKSADAIWAYGSFKHDNPSSNQTEIYRW